jgi:hypothetical protein
MAADKTGAVNLHGSHGADADAQRVRKGMPCEAE